MLVCITVPHTIRQIMVWSRGHRQKKSRRKRDSRGHKHVLQTAEPLTAPLLLFSDRFHSAPPETVKAAFETATELRLAGHNNFPNDASNASLPPWSAFGFQFSLMRSMPGINSRVSNFFNH